MSIWAIGDLHLLGPGENEQQEKDLLALRKIMPAEDDLIVLGDVTDDGRAHEYREASRLLSPWSEHLLLVPGNHDLGYKGLFLDSESERLWKYLVASTGAQDVLDRPGLRVVGLDSTLRTKSPLDLAQGKLGMRQLGRLAWHQRQAEKQGLKLVVACHHTATNSKWAEQLQDREQLMRAVWGRAAALLTAHSHGFRDGPHCGWGAKTLDVTVGAFRDGAEPYRLKVA